MVILPLLTWQMSWRGITKRSIILPILLFAFTTAPLYSQTTGKINGRVLDDGNGEPLIGANVVIEGSSRGAATDPNGDFFIINVPPGTYTLIVRMIGYQPVRVEDLRVSVNRTSDVEIRMKEQAIIGEEVVVVAEKVSVKKDQTSSVRNVSSDEIELLPVESIGAVVALQPGVVAGHFRGGRSNEVSYLIDGLQVDETFSGEGKTVDLEPEAIEDLEVITGTFNAEYGRAMSGVVNVVTKRGGEKFHGSASVEMGNYYTPNKDIFIGLSDSEVDRNQDYKLQLSGPLYGDKLTFFTNFRMQDFKNHLNGIQRFNVDDFSNFQAGDSTLWFSQHSGSGDFVSMNGRRNLSFTGKIASNFLNSLKVSFLYTLNDDEWNNYNHAFKFNPGGLASAFRRTDMYSLQMNHLVSNSTFYEVKLSYIDNFNGWYVFEDPLDPGYVHDRFLYNDGPGFFTGGQQKGHARRTLKDINAKLDLTTQLNKHHSIKTGFLYTHHDLENKDVQIRNRFFGTDQEFEQYEPIVLPDSAIFSDIYRVKPVEFSAYIQDKMEYDEMVINVGLRYDYFDPETVVPSQRRNPANQLRFPNNPEKKSTYPAADAKFQISPRIGLSYQLSDVALLHFSFGHFFQMPPLFALYQNSSFRVAPTNYATTMGNAQIEAQKTVQYEIGLWQQLADGMGLEVALFYRDIYDLLGADIVTTFNQIRYGLYSNLDYGNAKGIELKYDYVQGKISAYVNYTLQFTRGNAPNPLFTFNRAGDNKDPIPTFIPMDWDQRHTLNATVGYNTRRLGLTVTGYYNSGTPYTFSPLSESLLSRVNLYPNNATKPSQVNVDLTGYYNIPLAGRTNLKLTLSVFNLFDRLNEVFVNNQTGRAYTAIITESDLAGYRSNFSEFIDLVQDPSMFAPPRYVKLGMGVSF